MALPKVLIGCPTYKGKEYALQKYLDAIKELDYPNADILLVDNSDDDSYFKKLQAQKIPVVHVQKEADARQTVAKCRNVLRKKVLDEGYDYLFSFEQDLHSPTPGALHQLLSFQKKVISGLYFKRWNVRDEKTDKIVKENHRIPLLFPYDEKAPDRMQVLLSTEVLDAAKAKGVAIKVRMAGLGCCLIHRSVLEKIQFRTEPGKTPWDDTYFYTDLYKNGFDAWADPAVEFQHDDKFDAERKNI